MPSLERLQELAAAPDPRASLTSLFFLTPGPGVTDLLLIRHAQIESTLLGGDFHLTALGLEQAEMLASYLAKTDLSGLYVSPTIRARETAEPLARGHGLTVEAVSDLRDVDTFKPFNKPLPEMLADEYGPDEGRRVFERMRTEMTFGGMAGFMEPGAAFRVRITAAIDAIIARHAGECVAIVTHGPVIMSYVAEIVGSPRDLPFNPRLTSITRVLAQDGRRTLDYANATPHFEPGPGG